MDLKWNIREHRDIARKRKLAILHVDGPVGYIKYTEYYETGVVFPDWNGKKKENTYSNNSGLVSIVNVPYTEYVEKIKQKGETMNALYEITKEDGSKVFATKMAEKSKTLWVMEIKGSGEFVAVETTNIQEVLPYTVRVKLLGNGNPAHFEVEEGKVAVGDILVLEGGDMVSVTSLNTKQKGVPELKAVAKLVTVAF